MEALAAKDFDKLAKLGEDNFVNKLKEKHEESPD